VAKDFLSQAAALPSIPPRVLYRSPDKTRYVRTAEYTALAEEEWAGLDKFEVSEEFYYTTKYGTPFSPTLPGCFSNGRTFEVAKRNIHETIRQHVKSFLAHGPPIPQNEKRVHVEEMTLGVP
jgi:predicted RNase H-like HicB family nuclease